MKLLTSFYMRLTLSILLSLLISFNSFAQNKKAIKKGDEYFEIGRHNEALEQYELARESDEDDTYLHWRIAQCYVLQNNGRKAAQHTAELLRLRKAPTNEMFYTIAESYHLNHDLDKAIDYYKKSDPYNTNKKVISKKLQECSYGKKYIAAPQKVLITNMGKSVNSPEHDVLPQITADRMTLYFTSHRNGAMGDEGNPEDIYICVNKGGAWSRPINVGSPLNTSNNDACIGLSTDGQTMFLFKGSNLGDIYKSELKGDKWGKPEPLPFNTEYRETSASLSPDGRTLYFAKKVGTVSYLYKVSRTVSGRWSKPVRLPSTINDPGYDHESPFIHADGKTLFFSSKGHSSMGGYDIFKSEITSSGWSKPVNLGYPINTAGDDWGFVLAADAKYGYYASAKEGGQGKQDIYSIRMPPPKRNPQLALLKGNVKEEFTEKPIEAEITITDNDANEVVGIYKSNAKTGEFLISLPAGKNYGVAIEKPGHLFYSENVYLGQDAQFKQLNSEVKLTNIKPGSKVVLKNIFFESDQYALKSSSNAELDKIITLMKKEPGINIEISGHTDNVGSESYNQTLSLNRAQAVVDYLVTKGVPSERLVAKGYGSTLPVASNNTASGRSQNRRTEFKIIE